jgi:hypothetical protein
VRFGFADSATEAKGGDALSAKPKRTDPKTEPKRIFCSYRLLSLWLSEDKEDAKKLTKAEDARRLGEAEAQALLLRCLRQS